MKKRESLGVSKEIMTMSGRQMSVAYENGSKKMCNIVMKKKAKAHGISRWREKENSNWTARKLNEESSIVINQLYVCVNMKMSDGQ